MTKVGKRFEVGMSNAKRFISKVKAIVRARVHEPLPEQQQ